MTNGRSEQEHGDHMHTDAVETIFDKADTVVARLQREPEARAFVQDLLGFVKHILPVIAELRTSIAQTSEKLPTASQQLNKVTEANEIASTQILDIVERILAHAVEIRRVIVSDDQNMRVARIEALLAMLEQDMPERVETAELARVWREWSAARHEHEAAGMLAGIQGDCTSIMIALQVQDITAQQIAGVNRLMQSVDEGLQVLLQQIHEDETTEHRGRFAHKHLDIAHDSGAEYVNAVKRQQLADKVIRKHASKSRKG
jgi:chemotaxis regulatin CheY-phosphate phosphatase CheZ